MCLPATVASVCILDTSDAFKVQRDSPRNLNIMEILYQIDSMLIVVSFNMFNHGHKTICVLWIIYGHGVSLVFTSRGFISV